MNDAWLWSVCWICRRPSTASTIPCCCNDWNARSACLGWFCAGRRRHTLPAEVSCNTVSAVRSSAGVCFRPSALRSVHGRPQSSAGKSNHGLILHQYADDCQIYTSTPVDDAAAAVDQFSTSVNVVDSVRDLGVVIDSGLTMSTHHSSLLLGLLPAASATNDCAFVDRRCQENVSSVVRVMPTGLL